MDRLSNIGLMLEDTGEGLCVLAVREHRPARRAGFAPGDVLLTFNDAPVTDETQLEQALSGAFSDRTMSFSVQRNSQTVTAHLHRNPGGPRQRHAPHLSRHRQGHFAG